MTDEKKDRKHAAVGTPESNRRETVKGHPIIYREDAPFLRQYACEKCGIARFAVGAFLGEEECRG